MEGKNIFIQGYSGNKIFLSNGDSLNKSCVLSDEGRIFDVNIKGSLEKYLSDINNFNFVDIFRDMEILIVGCGHDFIIPSMKVRKFIYEKGLKLEWVTTDMAFQIFNILSEDRRRCFVLLINQIK